MSDEKDIALRDAAEAVAENAFFETRSGLDCPLNRRVFDYAFVRGWDRLLPDMTQHMAQLYAISLRRRRALRNLKGWRNETNAVSFFRRDCYRTSSRIYYFDCCFVWNGDDMSDDGQQQYHETVWQQDVQQEIERVILLAQTSTINEDDAALLRWASGTSERKHYALV